jgi:hypothetical protein
VGMKLHFFPPPLSSSSSCPEKAPHNLQMAPITIGQLASVASRSEVDIAWIKNISVMESLSRRNRCDAPHLKSALCTKVIMPCCRSIFVGLYNRHICYSFEFGCGWEKWQVYGFLLPQDIFCSHLKH